MDGTDPTSLIAHLMEATYRSTDPTEKVQLAALEMRARLMMEVWKRKVGVN